MKQGDYNVTITCDISLLPKGSPQRRSGCPDSHAKKQPQDNEPSCQQITAHLIRSACGLKPGWSEGIERIVWARVVSRCGVAHERNELDRLTCKITIQIRVRRSSHCSNQSIIRVRQQIVT